MARIQIPSSLQKLTGGNREIEIHASTIEEAFQRIREQHPLFVESVIFPSGKVPSYVNLYLDGEDIRYLQGLQTPIRDESRVTVLVALAGG